MTASILSALAAAAATFAVSRVPVVYRHILAYSARRKTKRRYEDSRFLKALRASPFRPIAQFSPDQHSDSVQRVGPGRIFDPDEMCKVGRIPLEYDFGSPGYLGLVRRLRASLLRPSSPKSAYAIANFATSDYSTVPEDGEYSAGGFRLVVELKHTESTRHFLRSLRTGTRTWKRTVAICGPGDLYCRDRVVTCFTVAPPVRRSDWRSTQHVTLYSSDPLFSGAHHGAEMWPDDLPGDTIWLVDIGCSNGDITQPSSYEGTPVSHSSFDPGIFRLRRYLIFLMLVLTFVIATFADATRPTLDMNDNIPWAVEATEDALVILILVIQFTAFYLFFVYLAWNMWWYFWFELPERWLRNAWNSLRAGSYLREVLRPTRMQTWQASTTRCVADGDRVRNGHEKDSPAR